MNGLRKATVGTITAALVGGAALGLAAPAPAGTPTARAVIVNPQTETECLYTVTADGLFIHTQPNANSTRVGETFRGDIAVSLPSTTSGGWVLGDSNGSHGWMSAAFLRFDSCHRVF